MELTREMLVGNLMKLNENIFKMQGQASALEQLIAIMDQPTPLPAPPDLKLAKPEEAATPD